MYDLVLAGGRVVDPGSGRDEVADVAFAGGRVAAVGAGLAGRERRDVSGCLVMPGNIDFHAHVYWGGTSISVDADALARRSGTTTWVDAGSAGPGNFAGFLKHVVEPSRTRILSFLHVSHAGIYAFAPTVMVGESQDLRLMDTANCAAVARAHPEVVRGIKVRVGAVASGANGIVPLYHALEAADRAGLPVMCHIDRPPPRYEDVVRELRPGDVLTHCFRPFPNAPCRADGSVREAVLAARERGVWFDVAHGQGSFDFDVAEAMLRAGFWPDVISSDVHVLCVDGPAFDTMETMTKFLHLGMAVPDIVRAVTATPAAILRRPELGSLAAGSVGDATVMRVEEGRFRLTDSTGAVREAGQRFGLECVVVGGAMWHGGEGVARAAE